MTNSTAIETLEQKIADLNEQIEKANTELKLQAELQEREVQIEAALEKVRASSMAMHHSDDLVSVINVVKEQLIQLGFHFHAANFVTDKSDQGYTMWLASPTESFPHKIYVPQIQRDLFRGVINAIEQGLDFATYTLSFEEKNLYFKYLFENSLISSTSEEGKKLVFESPGLTASVVLLNKIRLNLMNLDLIPYTDEENLILKRIAYVFEQSFIRFLDLQKAEAQAREAEIQLALERVRARTMAMQNGNELSDTAKVLFEQFTSLGYHPDRFAIAIVNEEERVFDYWVTQHGGFFLDTALKFSIDEPHVMQKMYQAWKTKTRYITLDLQGQSLKEYFKFLSDSNAPVNPDKFIERRVQNVATFSKGILTIISKDPTPKEVIELLERFAQVFDGTYTRFLDLKNAEAQAREAQIETGLERVRSKTMAMHKSEEVTGIAVSLNDELMKLGFVGGSSIIIIDKETGDTEQWTGFSEDRTLRSCYVPYFNHPFHHALIGAWKKGEKFLVYTIAGEEKKTLDEHYFSTGYKIFPENDKKWMRAMKHVTFSHAFMKYGAIHWGPDHLSDEQLRILHRFAKVFEQAYTRFLDLKKAEAQVREANIEAALERVRSRTMAMHHSEEIADIVGKIFKELRLLDLVLNRVLIWIFNDAEQYITWWSSNPEIESNAESYRINYNDQPVFFNYLQAWKYRTPLHLYTLSGDLKKKWEDHLFTNTELSKLPMAVRKGMREEGTIFTTSTISDYGLMMVGSFEPLSNESIDIIQRFGRVFQQSYTRYLDVQKAETQAREANIEAALEKVRSRSLAMHKSEEMRDMVKVVFERLKELNFAIDGGVFIGIPDTSTNSFNLWVGDDHAEYPTCFNLPYHDAAPIADVWGATQDGSDFLSKIYSKEEKNKWFHFAFEHTDFKILPEELKDWILKQEYLTQTFALAKHSGIGIHFHHSRELAVSEIDILKRFTKVFEQGYIRFLDLQKAEAQAREAKIESALERVRSRSMGMQKSEELKEVIQVVYEQFVHLNIHMEHTGFVMDYMTTNDRNIWVASKHAVPSYLTIPYFDSEYYNSFNEAKEKGMNFFATNLTFEEKNSFYQQLFKYIPNLPDEAKEFYFSCPALAVSTVLLDNVALYIENFEGIAFSDEDNTILMRFGKVFQQTYTRFLDLQKAEAQAREAKIEAALEKVRSRSLAMHKSDELQEVVHTVIGRLTELNVEVFTTIIITFAEDSKDIVWWLENKMSDQFPHILLKYEDNSYLKDVFEARKNGKELFSKCYVGQEKKELYQYLFDHTDLRHTPESQKEFLFGNEFAAISIAFAQNTAIHITSYSKRSFSEEETDILKRFAKVFDQAYTRFLDLQKAEAQAREAEIELALERVRARTMAMQSPTEFAEVIRVIGGQFTHLGFDIEWANFGANGLDIAEGIDTWNFAVVPGTDPVSSRLFIPRFDHPLFTEAAEQLANYLKTGNDLFVMTYGKEDKDLWLDHLFTKTIFKDVPEEYRAIQYAKPGYTTSNLALKDTFLSIGKFDPISFTEEQHAILRRFGNAFGLAYTRFLDLQKAEAQAREAKIEASLEKVRSRTMGMQHSNELQETAQLLFQQFQGLGTAQWACGFVIWDDDRHTATAWMSSVAGLHPSFKVDSSKDVFVPIYKAAQRGESLFVYEQSGKELETHYEHMSTIRIFREVIMNDWEKAGIPLPTFQIIHCAYFAQGYLMFISFEPLPSYYDIFKRFAKVFEQTYTRFLDLQKAEAQARGALIEAGLERVRARALAMQEPEELKDVAEVLRNEMGALGVEELETCSIYIHEKDSETAECWYALKDPKETEKRMVADHFHLELNDTWVGREMKKFYSSDEKQTSIVMQGADRKEWINYCYKHSPVFSGFYGETIPDRTYHLYKFSHGYIGAAAPGDISAESWRLLSRAASVFSLAYSRFKDLTQARNDLIKLREEKKRAEDALTELQATQKQLIQSEKMASLGELTAGIAHEIQNPLNFVNNFSDVSNELIEELKIKNEKLKIEDEEVKDLLSDISQNLEKISHHGKRADAIVKGMLQHSRSSSGQKELTDINTLAEEYIRLAYHGLRAKDKFFSSKFETELDPSLDKINIVPQEIGRVILNLINNSFYAVNEKKKNTGNGYEPIVIVSTKAVKSLPGGGGSAVIEISVKDNGNGIPQKVLDKIFQPFFTTKPTGQGTGLGLSLSYDIVTKGHNGDIKVETKEGEGSIFTITLPMN